MWHITPIVVQRQTIIVTVTIYSNCLPNTYTLKQLLLFSFASPEQVRSLVDQRGNVRET